MDTNEKVYRMKKSFLLMFLLFVGLSAFSQNLMGIKGASRFVNFNQLGISKEVLMKKFGKPIAKDLSYDEDENIDEALYYIGKDEEENLLIISKFRFKNNKLVELKSDFKYVEVEELLKKISKDVIYLKRWN